MKPLIDLLNKIKAQVPVEWDRWIKTEETYPAYTVYGWIERKDGKRDFVLVEWQEYAELFTSYIVTSSAKYSELLCFINAGTSEGHNHCRKIEELFKQQ